MNMIEETLNLNHFIPYAQAAAGLKKIGFFVPSPANTLLMPTVDLVVLDIQNNLKRLGYKVTATGQIDNATQQAVAAYVKKRKLNSAEPQAILASLCKDLRGACANISQIK
jgi:peptidoglycan hydrolase-like protein with peptidoglycan-binding domain